MSRVRPSYEKIDYNLRPAKVVERKMLADMLRRLDRASPVRHYRYVGLGSLYFSDFALFHRLLDFRTMISIEREKSDEARFEFNRPFAAIELKFGEAAEVLPQLDWEQRSVVWLDFDDPLNEAILGDVATCASKLASGSVLIVSVSADLGWDRDARLEALKENLGERTPVGLTIDDLDGWDLASIYQKVLTSEINRAVRNRNFGRPEVARVDYSQLVNFRYSDGARMMTVGGMLLGPSDNSSFRSCAFDDFEFFRDGDDAYLIQLPLLTPKEIRHLDRLLPTADEVDATDVGIPKRQTSKYVDIYRYFPRFVDVDY